MTEDLVQRYLPPEMTIQPFTDTFLRNNLAHEKGIAAAKVIIALANECKCQTLPRSTVLCNPQHTILPMNCLEILGRRCEICQQPTRSPIQDHGQHF